MELRDYLRTIRRRWLIIVACAVLSVGLASVYLLRQTPIYTSRIQMFVSTPATADGTAYQGGQFSLQRVSSYADLIVGQQVATSVVRELGLDVSPRVVQSKLTARVIPDTVLFNLTASDPDPARAQAIADAAGVAFTALVADLESPGGGATAPIKVTVVDVADLPSSPSSPQPSRTLPLAFVLGVLAGVGLALLREVLDVTVKDVERLGVIADAPALGLLAFDGDARKQALPVASKPHSAHAEAFRQLRTNLQFVDIDQTTKTIVVTSSLPEEGKTRTATNLAIAIAQAGQRVVLVEADMRRPKVSSYLGVIDDVGVTTVLIGSISLDEALQPYGDLPMHVLACGPRPPNPSELLSSERMADLLMSLRKRADVVIVDAPPLLPVTDAAVLARQADGAILVVRHGKTTYDQVSRSVENLSLAGARLLGTVINMAPSGGGDAYAYAYTYTYEPLDARRAPFKGASRPFRRPLPRKVGVGSEERVD